MFACGCTGRELVKDNLSRTLWFSTESEEEALSSSSSSFYHFLYPERLQRDLETYEFSKIRHLRDKRVSSLRPEVDLKAACRLGLRDEIRPEVWRRQLRIDDFNKKNGADFYSGLLTRRVSRRTARAIEVDLPRTFPENEFFREVDNLVKLRNILFAFSVHRPEISYCQGLNFIAAICLLVFEGQEETAFAALANLIDSEFPEVGLHIADYYTSGMRGILVDLRAISFFVASKDARTLSPKYPLEIFSSEWLHGLFTTVFPITVVLRIWDALISEGWKILFRVSAAIWLRLLGPVISALDTETVLANYKRSLRNFVDHQALLAAALHDLGSVSRKELIKFRTRASGVLPVLSGGTAGSREWRDEEGVVVESIEILGK